MRTLIKNKKGAGLTSFLEGIGLVLLFSIALIIFLQRFIYVNNPDSTAFNDATINASLNKFKTAGTNLENIGNDAADVLSKDQPTAVYLFLILKSAFTIPLNFLSFLVNSVGGILVFLFSSIFGANAGNPFSIVLGIIGGIMIIGIVLAIIRNIRTGDDR